jgi:hypothetical protein
MSSSCSKPSDSISFLSLMARSSLPLCMIVSVSQTELDYSSAGGRGGGPGGS